MPFRVGIVAFVLLFTANLAAADPVSGGELFIVIATDGDFLTSPGGEGGDELYTIAHLITFGPGVYPGGLTALAFPLLESGVPIPTVAGNEFFLIGALNPDHLLLSNSNAGQVPSDAVPDPIDQVLREGTLGYLTTLGVVATTSATQFWSNFEGVAPETFFTLRGFGPNGPVSSFSGAFFQEGSEDLFGFTEPEAAGTLLGGLESYTYENEQGDGFGPVPEPASIALVLLAVGAGAARRRRRAA
ncbi:MAG: PEP-CTERM sorting domain-containing protein [Planctomycetota bacterium]